MQVLITQEELQRVCDELKIDLLDAIKDELKQIALTQAKDIIWVETTNMVNQIVREKKLTGELKPVMEKICKEIFEDKDGKMKESVTKVVNYYLTDRF